jgi:iron-sulfur cluster repair protein YtfE (RIC family)
MDAFELLKTDHEKVSQLFKEIESASGQAKRGLFTRLKNELDIHAHIEEKVLYPALENTEEARDITLEAYEEHKVVKDLLAELAQGGPINDEWDAKLTVLKENVEHHVEEEEGDLFSKARKALSEEEIDRIGAELEAEKAKAQGATVKTSRAAKGKRSSPSTRAASGSTPASTGKSGSRRQPTKSRSGAENPGVLKRIANFIGLGDSSTSESKGKKTTRAKSASKTSSSKASGNKRPAKRAPAKAASGSKTKSAAKRSGTRKAGKANASARASVRQAASRANKRQSTSKGRKATTKAAARAGSKKRGSTKRKTAR